MISAQQEKAALRHIARQNRRAAYAAKGDISTQLQQHFPYEGMPERGVAVGYWPAGSEASGVDALGVLYEQGWSVYLPHRLEDDGNMDFAAWASGQEMQPGRLGISIPAGVPAIDLESVDLVVIPLLAFDETGARLGQGAGISTGPWRNGCLQNLCLLLASPMKSSNCLLYRLKPMTSGWTM